MITSVGNDWNKGDVATLLGRKQVRTATLKTSTEISQKVKTRSTVSCKNPMAGFICIQNEISVPRRALNSHVC